MFTFHDKKKNKHILLKESVIITHSKSLTSGATSPLPNFLAGLRELDQIIGGHREENRNQFIGLVITKPRVNTFIVGTSYKDIADNYKYDEDLTLFTETSPRFFEVKRLKKSKAEKKFPEWTGYHHSNKSYLGE